MDWSVVVMGCLLVLLSFGFRWWEQAKIRKGVSPRQSVHYSFPLLIGLGMIVGKTPHLLGASFAVLRTADSLSAVLTVTAAVGLLVQAARRAGSGRGAQP
ncbi:hypothetical protein [Streptomyces sp. CA-106131]|uniref:hypothetical protein n=1 Tax=Streptomyces sp. CA-106131 TaxID=3240045 RepID=UPI003D9401D6